MEPDLDRLATVTVAQGEFRITRDPSVVFSTILGSCVSICLFDPHSKIGGMNHFLLPGRGEARGGGERYGMNAMELLVNGLLKGGASRENFVAKVFGGGSMSAGFDQIGQSNARFAQRYLEDEGIVCATSDLGGSSARRIKYHPTSGRVRLFKVPKNAVLNDPVDKVPAPVANAPDVTLF